MATTQATFDVKLPISFSSAVSTIWNLAVMMVTTHPLGGSLFLLMVFAGFLVWLNEPIKRARR